MSTKPDVLLGIVSQHLRDCLKVVPLEFTDHLRAQDPEVVKDAFQQQMAEFGIPADDIDWNLVAATVFATGVTFGGRWADMAFSDEVGPNGEVPSDMDRARAMSTSLVMHILGSRLALAFLDPAEVTMPDSPEAL